jgi:hypothetical protein
MEFKSLVMSLEPEAVLRRALEYEMIPHEILPQSIPSSAVSILQQLNESPDEMLKLHSLSSNDENHENTKKTLEPKSQLSKDPRDKSCLVM